MQFLPVCGRTQSQETKAKVSVDGRILAKNPFGAMYRDHNTSVNPIRQEEMDEEQYLRMNHTWPPRTIEALSQDLWFTDNNIHDRTNVRQLIFPIRTNETYRKCILNPL